jgi:hypothetical protein
LRFLTYNKNIRVDDIYSTSGARFFIKKRVLASKLGYHVFSGRDISYLLKETDFTIQINRYHDSLILLCNLLVTFIIH